MQTKHTRTRPHARIVHASRRLFVATVRAYLVGSDLRYTPTVSGWVSSPGFSGETFEDFAKRVRALPWPPRFSRDRAVRRLLHTEAAQLLGSERFHAAEPTTTKLLIQ